jgi:hypothetical protein
LQGGEVFLLALLFLFRTAAAAVLDHEILLFGSQMKILAVIADSVVAVPLIGELLVFHDGLEFLFREGSRV